MLSKPVPKWKIAYFDYSESRTNEAMLSFASDPVKVYSNLGFKILDTSRTPSPNVYAINSKSLSYLLLHFPITML